MAAHLDKRWPVEGVVGLPCRDSERITRDYRIMGGRPWIRGMRVTVGTIVGLLAQGYSREAVLDAYPYLEPEDLAQALTYAAWRSLQESHRKRLPDG